MMNAIDALSWLRSVRGTIHFERDGTVTVVVFGRAQRGATVGDAATAMMGIYNQIPVNYDNLMRWAGYK